MSIGTLVLALSLLAAGSAPTAAPTAAPLTVVRVNVNTADEAALKALPGIGGKEAKAIVKYRKKHGPFKTIDDLAKVDGVGKKDVEKIRASVSL